MANFLAYYVDMKSANIAEFKNHLGKYITMVEQGEEILLCRRNVPVARIIPAKKEEITNKTQLGCGAGTVTIKTDLTEPVFSEQDWNMLQGKL